MELDKIIKRYASYVSCIRECLQAKEISPKALCSNLLSVSAFDHTQQKRMLLSAHEVELNKAVDLFDVFNILTREYASFLNYDIFQYILDKYQINHGQEELKYPEHLDAYVTKHKISEFIKINPLLKKFTATSEELVLKIDIESTSRLAKLTRLKPAIAKIVGLTTAALQLVDITDGCLVVTFLIPTPLAQLIFNEHIILTSEQIKHFQDLQVSWIKCNGCTLNLSAEITEGTAFGKEDV